MPRKANRPHELRLRNRQGKAVCSYKNREYRFGPWDVAHDRPSPEAQAAFLRQVGLWALNPDADTLADDSPTLVSLWAAWLASPQAPRMAVALIDLCESQLFGTADAPGPHLHTRVSGFTAADFLVWQDGLCAAVNDAGGLRFGRASVSKFTSLLRRCLDWGVTVGKVSADQFAAIARVKPPARGRVKEPVPRGSVPYEVVERVAAELEDTVGGLLRLMWWTGARPGELCGISVGMVQRGGVIRSRLRGEVSVDLDQFGVWAAHLGERHKTAHHGKERVIFFGPRSQGILRPQIDGRAAAEPLFAARTGSAYTPPQIREYARRRARALGLPHFTPYQIDHSFLSRVMVAFSSDMPGTGPIAAAAARGHPLPGITKVYTGLDWITAARVAQKCG